MTDSHANRRRLTTVAVLVLALLVPVLSGAVMFLTVRSFEQAEQIQVQTDANTAAVARLQDQADQIQAERRDSLLRSCKSDNRQSQANLRFLRRLGVSEQAIKVAREVYPIIADCEAYADDRVGPE